MDLVRKTLRPLGRAAHAFFRCDLRVQLKGGVRVALSDPATRHEPTPQDLLAERERAELALILVQLGAALDDDLEIRDGLRHLAFIENALQQSGLRALHTVPLDVLRRAHEQFEGLVTNWEPRGLAALRSKMAVAVMDREGQDEDASAAAEAET
jgi:hypothetical protein